MKRSTYQAAQALKLALQGEDAGTRRIVESLVRLERALQDDVAMHEYDRHALHRAVAQTNDALNAYARARGSLIGATELALALGRVDGAIPA